MSNDELELKLIKGSTIVYDGMKIKPLLVGEIIDEEESDNGIGYDKYMNLLSVLTISKDNLQDIPEEQLKEIETFDIFMFNEQLMILLVDFLKVFLRNDKIEYMSEQQLIVIDYGDSLACIHRDNYDNVMSIFRKMYCISIDKKEDDYNPVTDSARALVERLKQRDAEIARVKGKTAPNIFSIISGVAWKSNNINVFEIFKLNIFQLYDAYYRLEIIENYHNTMTGIYTGNIESKSIKQNELTWVKRYNPFN